MTIEQISGKIFDQTNHTGTIKMKQMNDKKSKEHENKRTNEQTNKQSKKRIIVRDKILRGIKIKTKGGVKRIGRV